MRASCSSNPARRVCDASSAVRTRSLSSSNVRSPASSRASACSIVVTRVERLACARSRSSCRVADPRFELACGFFEPRHFDRQARRRARRARRATPLPQTFAAPAPASPRAPQTAPLRRIQEVVGGALLGLDAGDRFARLVLPRLLHPELFFGGPPLGRNLFLLAGDALDRSRARPTPGARSRRSPSPGGAAHSAARDRGLQGDDGRRRVTRSRREAGPTRCARPRRARAAP